MLFATPELGPADRRVLELIAGQKARLRAYAQEAPQRWLGSLRRIAIARAIQGSNSIEGYHATLEEAVAAVEGETPADDRTETWRAIRGYREALSCIGQAALDPHFEFGKQFLKSLHFMMVGYDLAKLPGQWRTGPIYVVDSRSGEAVYEGPPATRVDALMGELVRFLKARDGDPAIVKGAMAHLNLAMIHPFKDGNGRMARALQTLVIALDGQLHPVFSSIEEWLGRNTQRYYDVLAETGGGAWNPARSALPWVRFCLTAHYQQAATLIRRNEEGALLFRAIAERTRRAKLPDRVNVPLYNAALGLTLSNARYRADAEVGDLTASRDLKRLIEAGLLTAAGEKRGRVYRAAADLERLSAANRLPRDLDDPYALVARRR